MPSNRGWTSGKRRGLPERMQMVICQLRKWGGPLKGVIRLLKRDSGLIQGKFRVDMIIRTVYGCF